MSSKLLRVAAPFDVNLESNRVGRTVAHVLLLPGCIVRASTPDLALANVKVAIEQYIIWLAAHSNSRLRALPAIHINIAERCQGGAALGSGSRVALLSADLTPMSKSEPKEYLCRMKFSRMDLLEIVAAIPEDMLTSRPNKRQRSFREILQHIAGAEQWYLTRLMSIPRFEVQPTPFKRLELVRETAYTRLSKQEGYLSGKVKTKWSEEWTLRKVLRRFLEHEREHILELEWRLHEMGLFSLPRWMSHNVQIRELTLAKVFHFK